MVSLRESLSVDLGGFANFECHQVFQQFLCSSLDDDAVTGEANSKYGRQDARCRDESFCCSRIEGLRQYFIDTD